MRTGEDALLLAELRARTGLEPGSAEPYGDQPAGTGAGFGPARPGSRAQPASVAVHDLADLAAADGPPLWCVCIASEADAPVQATA